MSGSKESEKSITSYSLNSNKTSQSNDEHHDGVENKVHDGDSMDSISSFVTMDDDGEEVQEIVTDGEQEALTISVTNNPFSDSEESADENETGGRKRKWQERSIVEKSTRFVRKTNEQNSPLSFAGKINKEKVSDGDGKTNKEISRETAKEKGEAKTVAVLQINRLDIGVRGKVSDVKTVRSLLWQFGPLKMCRLSMSRLVEGFTQAFVAEFILPDSTSLVLNNLQPFHQQSFQVMKSKQLEESRSAIANGVRVQNERCVFVSNIAAKVTAIDIKTLFNKAGTVSSVTLPASHTNEHWRFAFVEFSKSIDADLAVSKFNGYEWEKQKIYVGNALSVPDQRKKAALQEVCENVKCPESPATVRGKVNGRSASPDSKCRSSSDKKDGATVSKSSVKVVTQSQPMVCSSQSDNVHRNTTCRTSAAATTATSSTSVSTSSESTLKPCIDQKSSWSNASSSGQAVSFSSVVSVQPSAGRRRWSKTVNAGVSYTTAVLTTTTQSSLSVIAKPAQTSVQSSKTTHSPVVTIVSAVRKQLDRSANVANVSESTASDCRHTTLNPTLYTTNTAQRNDVTSFSSQIPHLPLYDHTVPPPPLQFPLNTAAHQQQPTQAANYQPVVTDNTVGMLSKPNPIVPHGAPLQQYSHSFRQEISVGQFVDPASALQHSNIKLQVGSSVASEGPSHHSNSLLGPYPGNGNAYSQPPLTMPLTEVLRTTGGEHLHAECRDLRELSIKGPGIDDDDLILSAIHLSSSKSRRLQPSSKSPDKHRMSSDSRSDRRTSSKWRDSQSINDYVEAGIKSLMAGEEAMEKLSTAVEDKQPTTDWDKLTFSDLLRLTALYLGPDVCPDVAEKGKCKLALSSSVLDKLQHASDRAKLASGFVEVDAKRYERYTSSDAAFSLPLPADEGISDLAGPTLMTSEDLVRLETAVRKQLSILSVQDYFVLAAKRALEAVLASEEVNYVRCVLDSLTEFTSHSISLQAGLLQNVVMSRRDGYLANAAASAASPQQVEIIRTLPANVDKLFGGRLVCKQRSQQNTPVAMQQRNAIAEEGTYLSSSSAASALNKPVVQPAIRVRLPPSINLQQLQLQPIPVLSSSSSRKVISTVNSEVNEAHHIVETSANVQRRLSLKRPSSGLSIDEHIVNGQHEDIGAVSSDAPRSSRLHDSVSLEPQCKMRRGKRGRLNNFHGGAELDNYRDYDDQLLDAYELIDEDISGNMSEDYANELTKSVEMTVTNRKRIWKNYRLPQQNYW